MKIFRKIVTVLLIIILLFGLSVGIYFLVKNGDILLPSETKNEVIAITNKGEELKAGNNYNIPSAFAFACSDTTSENKFEIVSNDIPNTNSTDVDRTLKLYKEFSNSNNKNEESYSISFKAKEVYPGEIAPNYPVEVVFQPSYTRDAYSFFISTNFQIIKYPDGNILDSGTVLFDNVLSSRTSQSFLANGGEIIFDTSFLTAKKGMPFTLFLDHSYGNDSSLFNAYISFMRQNFLFDDYNIPKFFNNNYVLIRNGNTKELISSASIHESYNRVKKNVLPLPEPQTKEGYTFTGWFLDEDCTIPYEGTTITEDTVLYAGWKINTYTVTFDSDGGSSVSNQTVDWNTSAQLTTPTKTGHTFVGWFLPSGEQYTNQPIKSATTLKAKWKANTYTVTFNSDGGSAVENKTVEYGKSVTLTSPTKTGFDFVGWFLPSGDKYTNQAITDNVTLTARWTIKKLSVSFNTDGGTSISDKQVEYGKPVELPTTEKQGYNFKGWFLPSGDSYTNQAITENVTLAAKWEIKTFKVTFIVDGEVYREMTVDYGTTLVDVANKAEVSSKNILSYKYVDESIPTTDLGSMKVVGDIEVKANAPTESDITISKIKNNTFAIIGGVLGGLVLIMVVCGVVTAIKRR